MINEILVVFQCKKLFVFQTTWLKLIYWDFFYEIWRKFLILLIRNISSIKIKPWFKFEVFLFYWEDENNWFLKLWFLKTSEAPTNPIFKIQ